MKVGVSLPEDLLVFADDEAERRGGVWWVRADKPRPVFDRRSTGLPEASVANARRLVAYS